jgi:hypothetical protein
MELKTINNEENREHSGIFCDFCKEEFQSGFKYHHMKDGKVTCIHCCGKYLNPNNISISRNEVVIISRYLAKWMPVLMTPREDLFELFSSLKDNSKSISENHAINTYYQILNRIVNLDEGRLIVN